jgi:shikimate kinase
MNIVLAGFMATGKTSVARAVASKMGMKYIDIDDIIEEREKRPIRVIFKEDGEKYFRQVEKKVAKEISEQDNFVVATGGGVVIDEENVRNLKKNGIIICLSAAVDVILQRTACSSCRPLLNVDDPKRRIETLLEARAPFYARADYTIDTSNMTVEEVAEEVIRISFDKQANSKLTPRTGKP